MGKCIDYEEAFTGQGSPQFKIRRGRTRVPNSIYNVLTTGHSLEIAAEKVHRPGRLL